MVKGIVAIIFLTVLLGCQGKSKVSPKEERPPNIVYVLADDFGYGDIGILNPEGKIPTPHIDRLAKEGIIFGDAHTSSSVCTPTRYGILTGRYNWRSPLKQGVLTGTSKALIPKGRTTVASLLKRDGYHTAFVGKWHLGWDWTLKKDSLGSGWNAQDFGNIDFTKAITNGPETLGFDYSYGHAGSLDMAPYVYVENGMPTAVPDTVTVDKGKYTWWREGPTAPDFVHDQVTPHFFDKAMAHIRERAESDDPFFLYLALPSPHTPILPTEEWLGKSGLNPYADFVMQVDAHMGALMKTLEETGISGNTLVIFTSDNGCSPQADYAVLGEQGHDPSYIYRGHKADIFEGGHRVPFIVRWPDMIKSGQHSDVAVCTTDFMATCADIADIEMVDGEGEDSFSMLPLFTNEGEFGRKAVVHHSINGSFAIRKGPWKLVFCPDSGGWSDPKPNSKGVKKQFPYQLYNLSSDPEETNNLCAQHPDRVAELRQLMVSIYENGRSTKGKSLQNDNPMNGKPWNQVD
ncbi:MAG: arylsulfatase, partial [Flavobacteriaceae bacterium]